MREYQLNRGAALDDLTTSMLHLVWRTCWIEGFLGNSLAGGDGWHSTFDDAAMLCECSFLHISVDMLHWFYCSIVMIDLPYLFNSSLLLLPRASEVLLLLCKLVDVNVVIRQHPSLPVRTRWHSSGCFPHQIEWGRVCPLQIWKAPIGLRGYRLSHRSERKKYHLEWPPAGKKEIKLVFFHNFTLRRLVIWWWRW